MRRDGTEVDDLMSAVVSDCSAKLSMGLSWPKHLYSHPIAAVADFICEAGRRELRAICAKNAANRAWLVVSGGNLSPLLAHISLS